MICPKLRGDAQHDFSGLQAKDAILHLTQTLEALGLSY